MQKKNVPDQSTTEAHFFSLLIDVNSLEQVFKWFYTVPYGRTTPSYAISSVCFLRSLVLIISLSGTVFGALPPMSHASMSI